MWPKNVGLKLSPGMIGERFVGEWIVTWFYWIRFTNSINKINCPFSYWFILLGNPLQKQKYHMKRCQRLLYLAQLPTLTTNSSTENLKDVPKDNLCSFHQPFHCKPSGWVTLATWEVTFREEMGEICEVLGMLIPTRESSEKVILVNRCLEEYVFTASIHVGFRMGNFFNFQGKFTLNRLNFQ